MAAAAAAESFLEGLCKPFLLYVVFMAALITYDITQADIKAAGKNALFLALGGALIFFLCMTGFEMAAWILLAIPPFFFTALIALLIITQIIKTKVKFADGSTRVVNSGSVDFDAENIKKFMGLDEDNGINTGSVGVDSLVGKPYKDQCGSPIIDQLPTPPALPSAEKIAIQLDAAKEAVQPILCPTCNTCSTCN